MRGDTHSGNLTRIPVSYPRPHNPKRTIHKFIEEKPGAHNETPKVCALWAVDDDDISFLK